MSEAKQDAVAVLPEVYCVNHCDWVGLFEDLKTDEHNDYCPKCGASSAMLLDIDITDEVERAILRYLKTQATATAPDEAQPDPLVVAFGEFRRKLRGILWKCGHASNPGSTDEEILAAVERLTAPDEVQRLRVRELEAALASIRAYATFVLSALTTTPQPARISAEQPEEARNA